MSKEYTQTIVIEDETMQGVIDKVNKFTSMIVNNSDYQFINITSWDVLSEQIATKETDGIVYEIYRYFGLIYCLVKSDMRFVQIELLNKLLEEYNGKDE